METTGTYTLRAIETDSDVLNTDSVVVVSDDLTTAELGGEAILLDVKSGNYFGLNEVGTFIVDLVRQPTSVASIVDIMLREFAVDPEDLQRDVMNFLSQLYDQGLVVIRNSNSHS